MKYKVSKENKDKRWEVGDIVFSNEILEDGELEIYSGDAPHKHVVIHVAPINVFNNVNEVQKNG